MKDADKAIDDVLKGLGAAEPPAGLERRILASIETREANMAQSAWQRWGWRPAMSLAGVVGFAGLCTIVLLRGGEQRPGLKTAARTGTAVTAQVAAHPAQVVTLSPSHPRLGVDKHAVVKAAMTHSCRAATKDELGALHLASFPAPPLPLTEQEKLLLRVARSSAAKAVAAPSSAEQATQMAKKQEQFEQFFGINPREMKNEIE